MPVGMAAIRLRPDAGGGCLSWAVWMAVPAVRSQTLAAWSAREPWAGRLPFIDVPDSCAVQVASCREQAASSLSSAAATGSEVMTAAQGEWPAGAAAGPLVKWV
jgi:hypothetical protein